MMLNSESMSVDGQILWIILIRKLHFKSRKFLYSLFSLVYTHQSLSKSKNIFIHWSQELYTCPVHPQPWPVAPPQHPSLLHHPKVQISQPSTQPVHFPPVVVLKVMPEQVGVCINHTHADRQTVPHTHAHTHKRTHITECHHTHTGVAMQINPQAEPCYSINVPAPVISALVRSVSDDLETTSPFNWCHAPLLLGNDRSSCWHHHGNPTKTYWV